MILQKVRSLVASKAPDSGIKTVVDTSSVSVQATKIDLRPRRSSSPIGLLTASRNVDGITSRKHSRNLAASLYPWLISQQRLLSQYIVLNESKK